MMRRIAALACAGALVAVACSSSDEAPDIVEEDVASVEDVYEPPAQDIEEEVAEVLRSMAETLTTTKQYSVSSLATTEEFLANGQTIELTYTAKAVVRRPDGLLVERTSDENHRWFVFDGTTFGVYDVDLKVHATEEIPGTLDVLMDTLHEQYGYAPPLADLFVGDPDAALSEFAETGIYVGKHLIRDKQAHHLAFSNDTLDWQVWVAADGPPVPLRVVIAYKDEPGSPRYTAHLYDWNLESEVPDEKFTFAAPEGSAEIAIIPHKDDEADDDADEAVGEEEDR